MRRIEVLQYQKSKDPKMAKAGTGIIPCSSRKHQQSGTLHLIQQEVRAAMEDVRTCRAVNMKTQGFWTRWGNDFERKVTWADLWKSESNMVNFLIQALYDILPSPASLMG